MRLTTHVPDPRGARRKSATTRAFWQIIVSLLGLTLTTYLMVVLAARFFRAGNLLSDASFSWRRLVTGWREQGAEIGSPDLTQDITGAGSITSRGDK